LDDGTECSDSQSELATSKATGNEELPEVTPVAQEHIDNKVCKETSAKRKLVFDTLKKRRRSIITNRAKRKRYKQKKYRWTKKDAERWKERAIAVESPLQASRLYQTLQGCSRKIFTHATHRVAVLDESCDLTVAAHLAKNWISANSTLSQKLSMLLKQKSLHDENPLHQAQTHQ